MNTRYGGTKEEMERLLADAEKISDVKYDISNLSDIFSAIHVIQQELDVTGTTAKEASTTITGSFNSAKSAFMNFLAGTGDIQTVVDTFVTAGTNIGKAIGQMAPTVITGIVDLFNGLIPYIPTAIQNLLPAILNGIMGLIQGVISVMPRMIMMLSQMLPTIIQQLATGLITIVNSLAQKLPAMIPNLVMAILKIIPVLLNNLPAFIDAGVQLIVGLANGLVTAIPMIIEALPQIIQGLVQGLVTLMPTLVAVTPIIMAKLGLGLVKAIPHLIVQIPSIIVAMAKGFKNGVGSFIDVGGNLIKGLWQGLSNKVDWVIGKIKGLGSSILKAVKKLFGIHSPSTEFAWVGKMNMEGLVEGTEGMKNEVQKAYNDMLDMGNFNGMFDLSPSLYGSATSNLRQNVNVVVNNEFEQDPLGAMVQKRKTFAGGSKNDYNFGMGV